LAIIYLFIYFFVYFQEREAALKMFGAHKALPSLHAEPKVETKNSSQLNEATIARIQVSCKGSTPSCNVNA
jgi:hypothetical protein